MRWRWNKAFLNPRAPKLVGACVFALYFGTHSLFSDSRSSDPIGPVVDADIRVLEDDGCPMIDDGQDNDPDRGGMNVDSSPLSSPPSPARQLPSSESPPRVRRSTLKGSGTSLSAD